jgi:hypothetical protein
MVETAKFGIDCLLSLAYYRPVSRIVNPKLAPMMDERSRQMDRMGRGPRALRCGMVWYDEYEMRAKSETRAQAPRNDDPSNEGLDHG